jgi:hypothetical protein
MSKEQEFSDLLKAEKRKRDAVLRANADLCYMCVMPFIEHLAANVSRDRFYELLREYNERTYYRVPGDNREPHQK